MDHVGLCPADFDASLRFYTDGIGLSVKFDVTLEMDMQGLLGVPTKSVRTVFLSDSTSPDASSLELLDLNDGKAATEEPRSGLPQRGLTLISFHVPVEETLARLAGIGLGGEPRLVPTPRGGFAATVVDPDGVVVELVDAPVSF
ncbi:MAG TPA: VOC family protein [Mycobacteriales bacterium]|jgi:catechol 2,3-dioxygenase-like lactoylglutathione lyase family enzyme|nr:VOC family protein [Mycobacteriales bacterium]